MQREQQDWQHEYNVIPWQYPISDNNSPIYYDQFIKLRDTLVFSNKIYAANAWRSLIIWTKLDWTPTDTIEIWTPNIATITFEPWWAVNMGVEGSYITTGQPWYPISCTIAKKWRYTVQHKEQFADIPSTVTRIHTYALLHTTGWTTLKLAEFDWEWNTPWEIKRLTSFGYRECNLDVWDWLELKIEDQNGNDIKSLMVYDSNWWMIEYTDLAY